MKRLVCNDGNICNKGYLYRSGNEVYSAKEIYHAKTPLKLNNIDDINKKSDIFNNLEKVCYQDNSRICGGKWVDDFNHACIKDCPVCLGIGYVAVEKNGVRTNDVVVCPNNRSKFNVQTGIASDDWAMDWPDLKNTKIKPQLKDLFSEYLIKRFGMVWIYGGYGVGKTSFGIIGTREAYQSGMSAYYTRMDDIKREFRSIYNDNNNQTYDDIMNRYINYDWLVIDEMLEFGKEYIKAVFSRLIDSRYRDAVNKLKVTIFISNYAPSKLYDRYFLDRIFDGRNKVVKLDGASMRPVMEFSK